MLQTRNCFAMLRWLRPPRGIRLLWIDAVCINQSDHQERDKQVAMMGRTYSNCTRTVLWLGGDLVPTMVPGHHPKWHRLPELDDKGPGIERLTQRRYFSRVWVIQELILSPKVILPVGNKIFWTDASMSARYPLTSIRWSDTAAPWAQYMCMAYVYSNSLDPVSR
jgi:hypothetical protein